MLNENIIYFFQWAITYWSNFIHVCKLNIATLFRIWFDVDSYVNLDSTVDSSKKTFSFAHKINLVTLVRTVTKTVLIRFTKTASLHLNHPCYALDIGEASAFKNRVSLLRLYTQ